MSLQFGFGSGTLWGLRTDVTPATPVRFGALQDIAIDFKGDIKDLFSTGQFPIDNARGKMKITGKAKLAEINAVQYNNLFFGQSMTTGQNLVAQGEAGTVPGTGPYTIQVANHSNFLSPGGNLGVRDATTGQSLQLVASPSATNQYSVSEATGTYTFNLADANRAVLFDYLYTGTNGFTITGANLLMGSAPRFKGVFTMTYEGSTMTMILYSCVSGSLSLPTKIDDYTIEEMEFSAYQNAAGQVFSLSMAGGSL